MQGLNGRLIEICINTIRMSFLDFTCSPPVEYPKTFDNWHDCNQSIRRIKIIN